MREHLLTLVLGLGSLGIGLLVGFFVIRNLPTMPAQLISPISEIIAQQPTTIIGFLPYWLLDKAAPAYTKQITTLAYFSLSLSPDGSIQKMVNPREEEPGWTTVKKPAVATRFQQARESGQKTSLVIFSGKEETIDSLVADPVTHANAVLHDVVPIMKDLQFQDLNLDIESVATASAQSQRNFTAFVQTIKNGLAENKLGTLTVDITVMSLFQQQLTNPVDMGRIADHVVVMTYDYHFPGSLLAGPVSPLGGAGTDRVYDVKTSMMAALFSIPKEKLVMGIPLYGYEWETLSPVPGSPAIPGSGQTASDQRVEDLIPTCPECQQRQDSVASEPFVTYSQGGFFHQLYYTDQAAIQKKLDFAHASNIAGVALWALGYEGSQTMSPFSVYKQSLTGGN